MPPRKGTRHVLRLIRDVLFFQPRGRGTSLREGLDFLNRVLRRRAIVFLFSDFLDHGYEMSFQRTGRRHDLIAVRVTDPREEELPAVGLLELEDAETGTRLLVDTSSRRVRDAYHAAAGNAARPCVSWRGRPGRSYRGVHGRRPPRRADPLFPAARTPPEEALTMLGFPLLFLTALAPGAVGVALPEQTRDGVTARLTVHVADAGPQPGAALVLLTLEVTGGPLLQVEPATLQDPMHAWEAQRNEWCRLADGRLTWTQSMQLKQVKPGPTALPDVQVRFRNGPAAAWQEVEWVDLLKARDSPPPELSQPAPRERPGCRGRDWPRRCWRWRRWLGDGAAAFGRRAGPSRRSKRRCGNCGDWSKTP